MLALSARTGFSARNNAVLSVTSRSSDEFVRIAFDAVVGQAARGHVRLVRADGIDVDELTERLARDHATGIVPGRFFNAPSHFRLAWGVDTETLRTGLGHLSTALDHR